MSSRSTSLVLVLTLAGMSLAGCGGPAADPAKGGPAGAAPKFKLAWSEYPSWSVFGVANDKGLIDGAAGKLGPLEKKWNVDIELAQLDYDPCLAAYGSKACDAVCITNMDVLAPSQTRDSVAILPTSTSVGADACIVIGIDDVKALRGKPVQGLSKSVSEYAFVRCLEKLGEKEADHKFEHKDPAAAATAMQTNQPDAKAIMVWNPFVMQTLKVRPEAKVLFDSSSIPGEIIDMVVVAKDALDKPGGKEFAAAVIDTYYEVNKLIENPKTKDDTLVALGAKFSSLGLEEMKTVVTQTKFYKTPEEGLAILKEENLQKVMPTVIDFCVKHDIIKATPAIGYGSSGGQLLFDPQYIELMKTKAGK
jgi:NitT/TauT family transport system substrate-binding protein